MRNTMGSTGSLPLLLPSFLVFLTRTCTASLFGIDGDDDGDDEGDDDASCLWCGFLLNRFAKVFSIFCLVCDVAVEVLELFISSLFDTSVFSPPLNREI